MLLMHKFERLWSEINNYILMAYIVLPLSYSFLVPCPPTISTQLSYKWNKWFNQSYRVHIMPQIFIPSGVDTHTQHTHTICYLSEVLIIALNVWCGKIWSQYDRLNLSPCLYGSCSCWGVNIIGGSDLRSKVCCRNWSTKTILGAFC